MLPEHSWDIAGAFYRHNKCGKIAWRVHSDPENRRGSFDHYLHPLTGGSVERNNLPYCAGCGEGISTWDQVTLLPELLAQALLARLRGGREGAASDAAL